MLQALLPPITSCYVITDKGLFQLKLRLDDECNSLTRQKIYGLWDALTKHVLREFNDVFSVHTAIFMRVGHINSCLVYY